MASLAHLELDDLVHQNCFAPQVACIDKFDGVGRLAELPQLTAESMLDLACELPDLLQCADLPYVAVGPEALTLGLSSRTQQLRFSVRIQDQHRQEEVYKRYFSPGVNVGLSAVVLEVTFPAGGEVLVNLRLLYGAEKATVQGEEERPLSLITIDCAGTMQCQRYVGSHDQTTVIDAFLGNSDMSTSCDGSGDTPFQRFMELMEDFYPTIESPGHMSLETDLLHVPALLDELDG